MRKQLQYFSLLLAFIAPGELHATEYTVDPNESRVIIRVYRAGLLKGLGHNHIVSTHAIDGRITYDRRQANSARFSLSLPVSRFVVDDPQLRQQAGEKFSATVDDDARAGTRKNMLGGKVLQADRFPVVTVKSGQITKISEQRFDVEMLLTLRSETRSLTVPVEISENKSALTATASFSLLQSTFGIKPLKAALGSIAVGDKLGIETRIVAISDGNNQK